MRVSLMLTCLCDAFYGEVGIAAVKVLEHAGCLVEFEERQTCCGQPPFNAGDWEAARKIAARATSLFPAEAYAKSGRFLVTPSASCAAMMRHGYPMLLPGGEPPHCYEIGEFLMGVIGPNRWPLRGNRVTRRRRLALHQACHSRALGASHSPTHPESLLALIPGLEVVPFAQADQCCGFGGAFSVTHGHTSSGIGLEKLRNAIDSGVEELVSTDMGCLMHLNGLIARNGLPLRTRHYMEVLAEAI